MGGTRKIVGVFNDFNWSSVHSPREAALFALRQGNYHLSLKVNTNNLPATIAAIERIYTRLFPGNPFQYAFVDEQFDGQYRNDQRFAALFSVFAVLAVLIACMGLFGLASFATRQRTKEVGIRKVLGATVAGIVALLSKDFVKLVLLANFIAWPLAYVAMNAWLQNFAYRIDIGWWVYALAGTMALLIALITVSTQAIKAAVANPVEALRYE
jgi:putative ABC transport system permease protein